MKKLLKVFLSVLLTFTICACSNKEDSFTSQFYEDSYMKVTFNDLDVYGEDEEYKGYIKANVTIDNKYNHDMRVGNLYVPKQNSITGDIALGYIEDEPLVINKDGTGTYLHINSYDVANYDIIDELECNLTISKKLMEKSNVNYPILCDDLVLIDDDHINTILKDVAVTLNEEGTVDKITGVATITNTSHNKEIIYDYDNLSDVQVDALDEYLFKPSEAKTYSYTYNQNLYYYHNTDGTLNISFNLFDSNENVLVNNYVFTIKYENNKVYATLDNSQKGIEGTIYEDINTLENLEINVETQAIDYHREDNQNVYPLYVKNSQLYYILFRDGKMNNEVYIPLIHDSYNKLDIKNNQVSQLQNLNSKEVGVYSCNSNEDFWNSFVYYNGQCLYTYTDTYRTVHLMYGNQEIYSGTTLDNDYYGIGLYNPDQPYVVIKYSYFENEQWIDTATIYQFDGTLHPIWQNKINEEWHYILNNKDGNIMIISKISQSDDQYSYQAYYYKDQQFTSFELNHPYQVRGSTVEYIGDYLLYRNYIVNLNTLTETSIQYKAYDDKNNIFNTSIFNECNNVMDIGNNMFLFTTREGYVYKGIIDEENGIILYHKCDEKFNVFNIYYNDGNSIYGFGENSYIYADNNENTECDVYYLSYQMKQ